MYRVMQSMTRTSQQVRRGVLEKSEGYAFIMTEDENFFGNMPQEHEKQY